MERENKLRESRENEAFGQLYADAQAVTLALAAMDLAVMARDLAAIEAWLDLLAAGLDVVIELS